ncbi:hypothetical protein BJY04DRAFT_108559 [Aspergillus karnatakaensis]|uniref:uncharacterized protein n=1 Tax=Aspergillus karnatakaensis TaxID=1810916 RepID=UPI003CCDF5EA
MAPSQAASAVAAANTPTPEYIDPSFDPVDFLNDTLPPLSLQSSQSQSQSPRAVNLAELATRVQSVLSQINAQNVRHSTTLTTLADDILRSGNRLAYEVEVLRGETITLSDLLSDSLAGDISRFTVTESKSIAEGTKQDGAEEGEGPEAENGVEEPEYISNLRTLTQVRARLEEVVQTFGDAMDWPLPPSETSITSSFISVSAPELGPDSHSREEKGQEVAKKLIGEIAELLDSDGGLGGIEAAARRVEALRALANVWKGTAEEKARARFVDGLMKTVEDRRKALEAVAAPAQQATSSGPSRGHQRQESEGPAGGIFRNLQRLREEIYLE